MGTVERPKNHKDLEVWKQSMELIDQVYRVTKGFPPEELYGLPRGIGGHALRIRAEERKRWEDVCRIHG